MIVGQSSPAANSYPVDRATLATVATAHLKGDPVLLLKTTYLVLPFERGFFENEASINYLHSVSMPDCRVFAAQMRMTNTFGDGQTVTNSYVNAPLRTLSGGQFSLQVGGYLATQSNAAPPLLVQAKHAVRDIWASVGQTAQGYSIGVVLLRNGTPYCEFTIPEQNTGSFDQQVPTLYVHGETLLPLMDGDILTMNIALNVAESGLLSPGRDLTVTIRF